MFIDRKNDVIYGLWTVRQWEGQEELAADDVEVVAFLTRPLVENRRDKAIDALLQQSALSSEAPQAVKDYIGNAKAL